ncbi:preprotein translocase subunit SecG [Metamycoplasma hyosynoviae]|uniref:Protein-export membrane protein SecG n=1 Tax=Metamycoplasma hyosynoviae TaxID=29559 RepID=A0A063Y8B5_9BACT|nr:preprotein translocase subunit SecG [Metamycoplasma hyosynoviae]KDE42738.1 preprotein translocase subunit SecG [Metamycoplasma hyosynoviae]MDC8901074.1 preprotein translocase subunit SecG [Metamycoplasma hyosynoviae]MDC8912579.1 preprotein translocase subunit SecG [Metamycoplasma hyosynoviae]MDC8913061.1 preprotein translocase subunit SecG [Metamycoplasma hyosynoviae]MDC8914958.1 preprotein translocase subunit SecG [Metamycoplasma hyosynoviae]
MKTGGIILTIMLLIFSLAIIFISLLLAPDSNSFSGALVGSGDLDLFKVSKERGVKKVLKWSMYSLGTLLLIFTIVLRVIMQKG